MLSYAAQGLSGLLTKHGKIRLLLGEQLSAEEYAAVRRGIELRSVENRIDEKLAVILQHVDSLLLKKRLQLLSWLVAAERLEIRFCLTDRGMFHEKMGVLTDHEGSRVVFQGSANETIAALSPDFNFESIVVFPSWKKELFREYASPFINRFELIWRGHSHHVSTIKIPSRSYELLRSYHKSHVAPNVDEGTLASYTFNVNRNGMFPLLPQGLSGREYKLREHQRVALQEWAANDYRGILAHATGSGKTISALHGATSLATFHKKSNRNFVLLVSVPYQVLADQWCEVMQLFGVHAHRCYRGKSYWQSALRQDIASLRLRTQPTFVGIVAVNATLQSEGFQDILSKIDVNDLLFVGDECHHHQSSSILQKLPGARYRLGLSATPWRSGDTEAQSRMREYYSDVVSTYSIEHALNDRVLVPYLYHQTAIELTEEEAEEYQRLSEKLAQLLAAKENGAEIDENYLGHLVRRRTRILGSAELKFKALETAILKAKRPTHCLVYCGDGSTEGPGDHGSLRDVEKVARILHRHGWKSSRFTAEESHTDRQRILKNFQYAYIDVIVAIRVLDEGFDMPQCQTAYMLASSRNERQFIQRRGRILRTCPGKESAVIYDYIMTPPSNEVSEALRNMVSQELLRAIEFARFCTNREDAMGIISTIGNRYDLDIEQLESEVVHMELQVQDRESDTSEQG